jgi:hypothetical protein
LFAYEKVAPHPRAAWIDGRSRSAKLNRSQRQDRSAAIGRKNIKFIIDGHPDAVKLFV